MNAGPGYFGRRHKCHLSLSGGTLPVRDYQEGRQARIYLYERGNGRCPACDFLEELERHLFKKFAGSFVAVMNLGAEYKVDSRFKALGGAGKPLWEFKEHG